MDRTAQEREDHILDCYETIKQRDAEIERLRGLADYWHRMHDAVHDEKERMRAERDKLVADKKALAFQLDSTIANLSRNEAEVERLRAAPQSILDWNDRLRRIAAAHAARGRCP